MVVVIFVLKHLEHYSTLFVDFLIRSLVEKGPKSLTSSQQRESHADVFFDSRGIVWVEYISEGQTINGVLLGSGRLCDAGQKKWPEMSA